MQAKAGRFLPDCACSGMLGKGMRPCLITGEQVPPSIGCAPAPPNRSSGHVPDVASYSRLQAQGVSLRRSTALVGSIGKICIIEHWEGISGVEP